MKSLSPEKDLTIKDINQVKPVEPVVELPSTDPKVIAKDRWKQLQVEESRMVKGKFIYHECPNGIMEFSFRKYKSTPLKNYSLRDGETYEIPLAVARHLNTNVAYPTHAFKNNEAGKAESHVSEMIRRTSFQALEFFS